MPCSSGWRRAQ